MQIKGLGDHLRVPENYVKVINKFIKRLQIVRHSRKEFISSIHRNERIKLTRRLRSQETLLSRISKQSGFNSRPFVHTVISGKSILLNKSVLISRSTLHSQVSYSNYFRTTMDQTIKQFLHLKNNFEFYWGVMDKNQRAYMLRFMARYAKKPVFKKIVIGSQKLRKKPFQKITTVKNRINKSNSQNKLVNKAPQEKESIKQAQNSKISNEQKRTKPIQIVIGNQKLRKKPFKKITPEKNRINKSNSQNKLVNKAPQEKESIKQAQNSKISNEQERTKPIHKVPRKTNEQENYNPYSEQDLDIYIDSILEDCIDQNVNQDEV